MRIVLIFLCWPVVSCGIGLSGERWFEPWDKYFLLHQKNSPVGFFHHKLMPEEDDLSPELYYTYYAYSRYPGFMEESIEPDTALGEPEIAGAVIVRSRLKMALSIDLRVLEYEEERWFKDGQRFASRGIYVGGSFVIYEGGEKNSFLSKRPPAAHLWIEALMASYSSDNSFFGGRSLAKGQPLSVLSLDLKEKKIGNLIISYTADHIMRVENYRIPVREYTIIRGDQTDRYFSHNGEVVVFSFFGGRFRALQSTRARIEHLFQDF